MQVQPIVQISKVEIDSEKSLEKIPKELIQEIFTHLTLPEVYKLALVSRQFNMMLVKNPSFQNTLLKVIKFIDRQKIEFLLHFNFPLTELDLKDSNTTDADLALLIEKFPTVKLLTLKGPKEIDLVKRIINLKLIKTEALNNLTKLNNLEFILLEDYKALKQNTISQFVIKNQGLRELRLRKCENIANEAIKGLTVMHTNLKALSFAFCEEDISDDSLANLCRVSTGIQELNLTYCRKITGESIKMISSKLTNLETLLLFGNYRINGPALEELTRLTNLKKLDVGYNENVTDRVLKTIVTKLPNLEYLYFRDCYKVTNPGAIEVAAKLTRLRQLSLNEKIIGLSV